MLSVTIRSPNFDVMPGQADEIRRELVERLANICYDEMLMRVPVRTGLLKASIRKEIREFEAYIGTKVPYGIYVEEGTRPHIIRPVRAHALRFEVGGKFIFSRIVRHPGTKPRYFASRAFGAMLGKLPEIFHEIWARVMK